MSHSRFDNRPGLTLLELVIVLGILAVLSTVAVRSLEPIADQARYEQSQKLLNEIHRTVLGKVESGLPFGSSNRSGYISDTGAFPNDIDNFFILPAGIIQRTLHSFDSDRDTVDDIQLSSGWNGPYLQLGAGVTSTVDGWGNEPLLLSQAGNMTIQSLGADGDSVFPEDGYRQDLTVVIQPTEYLGTLVFRLFEIDSQNGSRIDPAPSGNERLGVLYYGINATGGTSGAITEQLLIVNNGGSFEYRRENTTIGGTAARAIRWDDSNSNNSWDIGESLIKKSIVHYPNVVERIDTRIELELR